MSDDQFGFGFEGRDRANHTEPNPVDVREDARAILNSARQVSVAQPWDAATLSYNRLIFPHLVSWLPADEAEQLCFEFARQVERIEQLLAA
ncbi:hypothetical protein ACVWZA_004237 [Sphingomonas sp. UYAg733]